MRVLYFVPLWLASGMTAVAYTPQCKCAPSDPCWPTAQEWSSLNQTVSGRLIKTVPPGSVCYKSEPNYNESACTSLLENWPNSEYHSSNPVTVSDPLWSNSSCTPVYPNGTSVSGDFNAGKKGCSIGNLSPFVVNATTAEHIKTTLRFAKKHNVRLNIKNTGHNPEKSSAFGSLSIWTHHMKDIKVHQFFKASNCSSQEGHQAVTIGAGVQDGELLDQLASRNLTTVTGTSSDVGVVGWATGGGHGVLTGVYGMGADNIIEAEIVTPDGHLLTVNKCHNEDLFWAIRGGGGGTFGVVLKLTINIFPMPSMSTATVAISTHNATSGNAWWALIARMHREMVKLQDEGIMGYYTASAAPYSFQYTMFQFNTKDTTSIKRSIGPMKKLVDEHSDIVESSTTSTWLPVWSLIEKLLVARGDAGTNYQARATRLLPRNAVQDTVSFSKVLKIAGERNGRFSHGVSNPSISGTMTISHKAVDSALNPAWRDAAVHFISSVQWDDKLPLSDAEKTITTVTNGTGYSLRQLAPDSGVYYNEANTWEPDWQYAFWGPNYPRALEIKQKYDPSNILWCRHCVGSEFLMQKENGSLCPAS